MSTAEAPPKGPKWSGLSHIQINKKEAMSGFRWSLIFSIINKFAIPLLNNAIVVRILGPSIIGAWTILYSIFSTSEILRDFGLSQTYMRDHDMTPKKEASYMMLGIMQGAVPGVVLYLLRIPFANFFKSPQLAPLMIWVSLGLVVNGFFTIPKAKVLKKGRIRESGMREMVANLVMFTLSITMVLKGYTYLALVIPLFVNCVLNTLITYSLAPVTNFMFDMPTMLRTARGAVSTLGASALYNLYVSSDKFVIGKLSGPVNVGLYGQAVGLAKKPMELLTVPMMAPLQAAFSQNSKNPEKIGSIYGRALAAALIFIVPMYAIMIVAAEPVTLALLGRKWGGSIPLVQIGCVFFAARTIGTIGGTALVAGGKARFAMTSWIFCYATAAIGCYLASLTGSVEGFAWAFSAGAVAVYTVHTVFAFRWYPPNEEARKKLKAACRITIFTTLLFLGIYFLPFGPWIELAIACILGPLVHLVLVGWGLERKPTAFLSPSGIKRLYHSL